MKNIDSNHLDDQPLPKKWTIAQIKELFKKHCNNRQTIYFYFDGNGLRFTELQVQKDNGTFVIHKNKKLQSSGLSIDEVVKILLKYNANDSWTITKN